MKWLHLGQFQFKLDKRFLVSELLFEPKPAVMVRSYSWKYFLTIFSYLGTRDQYIFVLGHPTCREINNLTSDKVCFYTICFLIWRQISKNTMNHRRNRKGHLNHAMCSFSTSNNQSYTIWRQIKYISTRYVFLFDVK